MMYYDQMKQPNRYDRSEHVMTCEYAEYHFGIPLEPCPFCKLKHLVIPALSYYPYVRCNFCGAEGPKANIREYEGIPQAILKWNNRTQLESPRYNVHP